MAVLSHCAHTTFLFDFGIQQGISVDHSCLVLSGRGRDRGSEALSHSSSGIVCLEVVCVCVCVCEKVGGGGGVICSTKYPIQQMEHRVVELC